MTPRNSSEWTTAYVTATTIEELNALEAEAVTSLEIAECEAHAMRQMLSRIRERRFEFERPHVRSRFKATVHVFDDGAQREEEHIVDAISRSIASDIINERMRSVCTAFSIQHLERVEVSP